ncbi:UDP-N-acetylglucosamine 2-epimerase [Crateriforma conspicua]|nr:UDP-N-acetylglucosamine 2-epimerase (non-hydrolyzing) [Crateriforma conspicua]QDV64772.1 UDP-N-acetylglucosamine 2-epimerase [Crateriforma conspicua]
MIRPFIVLGTRPEAVKLAPLIRHCLERSDDFDPIVCSTGQHREMLEQVLGYFEIQPDVDLRLMKHGQTLAELTASCMQAVTDALIKAKPDCVVVQGDTTTVMTASVAAFYQKIPVVHVEAGLRTGDLWAPWPEEFNRRVAAIVTRLHCAPTEGAANALRREGIDESKIRVTGNTVIDALLWAVGRERANSETWSQKYPFAMADDVVLITGHRRENFGQGLADMCDAIAELSDRHPQAQFIYPVHLNPNVKGPVYQRLDGHDNIHLVPPADYREFVWLMDRARVVLTDSGGVQEEAPSLGCDVFVTREKTERPEAVDAGLAHLVGTDRQKIVDSVSRSLQSVPASGGSTDETKIRNNPYGDGTASVQIADWMAEVFS